MTLDKLPLHLIPTLSGNSDESNITVTMQLYTVHIYTVVNLLCEIFSPDLDDKRRYKIHTGLGIFGWEKLWSYSRLFNARMGVLDDTLL